MNVCKTLGKWVFVSLLLTGAAFGQMTSMEGRVVGEDGKPINGAEVKITRTDIKANYSVKTKKDGKYQYATLPLGTYNVQWLVDGKTVYEMNQVHTDYAKPTEIDVDLAKIKQQQLAAAAGGPVAPAPGAAPPPPAAAAPPAQQTEAQKKAEAEARAKFEREKQDYEAQQKKNAALQGGFNTGVEAAKAASSATNIDEKNKNYQAAIDAFKQAGEADPKQDAVWSRLGEVYEDRAGTRKGAERLADYNAAVENFQKAIDLKPEDAAYRYHSSVMLARSNKLDEAAAQLEKAVQLDPTQAARGYSNLGHVYFETNRSEAAEKAYRKAIEIDPKAPAAYMGLARTFMQRLDEKDGKLVAPAGTTEALQKYLELAPTGVDAAEAQEDLKLLGSTIQNSVGKTPPAKSPAKGKGK